MLCRQPFEGSQSACLDNAIMPGTGMGEAVGIGCQRGRPSGREQGAHQKSGAATEVVCGVEVLWRKNGTLHTPCLCRTPAEVCPQTLHHMQHALSLSTKVADAANSRSRWGGCMEVGLLQGQHTTYMQVFRGEPCSAPSLGVRGAGAGKHRPHVQSRSSAHHSPPCRSPWPILFRCCARVGVSMGDWE